MQPYIKGAYWISSKIALATTIAIAIVGRAITIWEAIQKRSHGPNYKTYTKNEAKGLRATTLLSQSWKSDN